MAIPANIRKDLIAPNRTELEVFGVLGKRPITSGPRGGRPGTAFYLNEEQALLVCLLSRTERAKAVRAEVIRVFTAYRRGDLVAASAPQLPQLPNSIGAVSELGDPGEAAIAWGAYGSCIGREGVPLRSAVHPSRS